MATTTLHCPRPAAAGRRAAVSAPAWRLKRWSGAVLSLALLLSAPAAVSDPARTDATGTGCWHPGEAPSLFSWSNTPGIACRDGAEASGPVDTSPASAATRPAAKDTGRPATPAQVTFSGTAYAGVAVSF